METKKQQKKTGRFTIFGVFICLSCMLRVFETSIYIQPQKFLCPHKRHKERILIELCTFIAHFLVNFIEKYYVEPDFEHPQLQVCASRVYPISLNATTGNRYKRMLNIKKFSGHIFPSIQVHLFDYTTNFTLCNKIATITFHKRMRDELQLDGAESLKN